MSHLSALPVRRPCLLYMVADSAKACRQEARRNGVGPSLRGSHSVNGVEGDQRLRCPPDVIFLQNGCHAGVTGRNSVL